MVHVYTSPNLFRAMKNCYILDQEGEFERSISDHFPIVSEFEFMGKATEVFSEKSCTD